MGRVPTPAGDILKQGFQRRAVVPRDRIRNRTQPPGPLPVSAFTECFPGTDVTGGSAGDSQVASSLVAGGVFTGRLIADRVFMRRLVAGLMIKGRRIGGEVATPRNPRLRLAGRPVGRLRRRGPGVPEHPAAPGGRGTTQAQARGGGGPVSRIGTIVPAMNHGLAMRMPTVLVLTKVHGIRLMPITGRIDGLATRAFRHLIQ